MISSKEKAPVYLLRLHSSEALGYTVINEDSYRGLLQALPGIPFEITFRNPKEVSLSSDIGALLHALNGVLGRDRKKSPCCLILEFLDRNVDTDSYDDLSNALTLALSKQSATAPPCIVIAVPSVAVFKESVLLQKKLVPLCRRKNVLLLLVSDDTAVEAEMLVTSKRATSREKLPPLQAVRVGGETVRRKISVDEIRDLIHVLNGHFALSVGGSKSHVTGLINITQLARRQDFIEQVRDDVTRELGASEFTIFPIGIPSGGIRDLAIALVEGRTELLLADANIQEAKARKVVILCDVLGLPYRLPELIHRLRECGADDLVVCAVGLTRECSTPSEARFVSYVQLPISVCEPDSGSCIYCSQDISAIEGESFDDFALKIAQYDPVTFWELVAQDKRFFHVGHWASNRTPNHYHFQVLTEPLFRAYNSDIALRIRNCLTARGILPSFVQRIVIPDEPEARLLGDAIAPVLGLGSGDVISIPRNFLRTVAGQDVGREAIEYINETYGNEGLASANVLIADQAAHHLKTLSALRAVCDNYDATVLAFVVFLDRTDAELSIGEFLHDSHYLALYSWASPPRRAFECPCNLLKSR
jgi:hypothetical protein